MCARIHTHTHTHTHTKKSKTLERTFLKGEIEMLNKYIETQKQGKLKYEIQQKKYCDVNI